MVYSLPRVLGLRGLGFKVGIGIRDTCGPLKELVGGTGFRV